MPLFKRKSESDQPAQAPAAPAPAGLPEEVVAQEYQLKLYYAGKSSEGVRIKAGPRTMSELPTMLTGLTKSDVEVVDPLELELWLDQMSTVGLDSAVPSTAASFTRVERHEHCA